ncbi:hemicentin-1-like protein [Elysia marginata]|uniref:Hemicentin-1-like protein n=1 Tax=Elysia marginata TaxID=1093978 RepID=A0AAV4H3Q4_9GAST|nr:hemicentin-1-like protein [Elysia marginata]
MTVSDICSRDWIYHQHSGTCIRIYTRKKSFPSAKQSCESTRGGPVGNQPGWLVKIPDKETDDFVKSLLTQNAYIGLTKEGNKYEWLDKSSVGNAYNGWKSGYPRGGYYTYKYVLVTRSGWIDEYWFSTKHAYICQQYPSFSQPNLTCESAEEGKPFPKVYCRYPIDETVSDFVRSTVSLTAIRSSIFCDSNLQCHTPANISGNIYEERTSGLLTTEVIMDRAVTRKDNGIQLSCWYKFDNTPDNLLESLCKIQTYKLPHTVNCSYNYPRSGGILLMCETTGGYPKFTSIWRKDGQVLGPRQGMHKEETEGETLYYNSKFKWRFNQLSEGKHNFLVSMYPNINYANKEDKLKAIIIKTITFSISLPDNPPRFFVKNGQALTQGILTLTEDQTVTIVCEINEGVPQIRRTFVQCDGKYIKDTSGKTSWSNAGQRVRIELLVKRSMDQKTCTCSGYHVSNEYKKTVSVTLNVKHAADIVSFRSNRRSQNTVQVYERTQVSLACSAHGNPQPKLRIFRQGSNGKILQTLKETSGSSITVNIAEASCDTSGKYVCTAENSLSKNMSKREVNLRVRCSPQPCSQLYSDREFSIIPGTMTSFKICLFTYPEVNPAVRVKPKDKASLDKNSYSAKFESNAIETKGQVVVNMSSLVTEIGRYKIQLLQQSKWYDIDFSLVRFQKPHCPESLDNVLVGNRFVIFTWQPASDRGLPQTFIMKTLNNQGQVLDRQNIADNRHKEMSHNFTNLLPGSDYKFSLNVKNAQGTTECPHLMTNVTTVALPISAGNTDDRNTGVVAGTTVGLFIVLLVIIILVIVFLRRRRKNKQPKTPIWLRRGKKEPKTFIEVTELKTSSKRRNQQEPALDIYSKVNKPRKKVMEREESVYSNKAVIELYTRKQAFGSTQVPSEAYYSQRSFDDHCRGAHCLDWSDADSLDDLDSDATVKPGGFFRQYHSKVDPRQNLRRQVLAEYVNSAEIHNNPAFTDEDSCSLPTSSYTQITPYGVIANGHVGHEYSNVEISSSEDVSQLPKGKRKASPKAKKLVYIDVEIRPTEDGEARCQTGSAPSNVDNLEEPVDYASLSYDADVSDSGTLGDGHL